MQIASHKSELFKEPKDRLIFALDVPTSAEAISLIAELKDEVGLFKVGLELIAAAGVPRMAAILGDFEAPWFLDIKAKDIPNTVGATIKAAVAQGASMINIHADNSLAAIRAAAQNKGRAILLGVSVLTSIDPVEAELLLGRSVRAQVLYCARNLVLGGADGIICSPQELEMFRDYPELKGLIKITPAIRLPGQPQNDQRRTMTPAEAIEKDVDAIVVGRAISKPQEGKSCADMARLIVEEITQGLEARNA